MKTGLTGMKRMKFLKTPGLGFIISVLGLSVVAQNNDSTLKFSLAEAQNHAIENYYMSKNASLDVQAAKWKVWETTAIGLPQVSASVSYQHIPGEIPVMDFNENLPPEMQLTDSEGNPLFPPSPLAVENSVTYSATVSQLLFSGEYIVGLQASKAYKSMSEEAEVKTLQELKQMVTDSYTGLLILNSNRIVLEQTLSNLRDNLMRLQKSYEQGLVEDTEVDQIDLIVKQTENSLASMDRQIEFMTNMFKYQIGLEPEAEIMLTDEVDHLITLNIVNDSAYVFDLEENIDYKMLSTQEKLMQLSMRREQSTFLPTVAAFYQYTDKNRTPDFDFTINHIMGINLEVPIVTSGSRIAKTSQARIEYEKAQNEKEQEANRLVMMAQQARFDYNTALDKYFNEKLNLELSEKVFNKTNLKHKEGMVSSLELTLINNQYLQAQLSYSMAVQELLSAKVKMDKAHNLL